MDRRFVWGAVLWSLRPAYIVVELVVAAATTGGYDLTGDTVSRLGATECSTSFCSPLSGVLNGTFAVIGLMLAVGAVLLRPMIGRTVVALLVTAGLSSAGTGLFPVDEDATLHAVAAAPLFVCQPIALLLLARRLRPTRPRLATALLTTGVLAAVGAVGFVVGAPATGLLERVALWPVLIALAAVAIRQPRAW